MRSLLPAILLLTPALHAADESEPTPPQKKFSAVSMLPAGSQLHGVLLPRYDGNHRLTTVLKVKDMTLVNDDTFSGETVSVVFFNDDQTQRARVDMTRAVFDQEKGVLTATDPVTLHSDRMQAKGTGLKFTQQTNEGFLSGPCLTCIKPAPTATSMNSRHAPIRAAAILGMSLATLPLAATPPPALGKEDLARIQADTASRSSPAKQSADTATGNLAKDAADAAEASKSAREFTEKSGIKINDDPLATAPAKPLEVTPGPDDTIIESDRGMYFDADEGVVVYFGNVRVTDPRYKLTGAEELKVFLSKKPEDDKAKPKPEDNPAKSPPVPGSGIESKFNDVDRVVATGAVRVLQKAQEAGKDPVEASGAILVYKPKSGEMVLSGGYPWVKQGSYFARANQANLHLRMLKNGSYVTEGSWTMGGNLQQKDKDAKKDPHP